MASATLRKSITDLTRRKARAVFAVLSLAIAVASVGIDVGKSVAVQPDGKIVAVGFQATTTEGADVAIARYLAN